MKLDTQATNGISEPVLDLFLGGAHELCHLTNLESVFVTQRQRESVAKSHLLEELVQIDEAHSRIAKERGRLLLQSARDRLVEAGIEHVTTTHRHGGVVETVIEREADADLVVIGKRGASSEFAREHLGSRVERVVRESIRPVLVASRQFTAPARAMIAFDGGASARKAVEFAASSPLLAGVEIDLVMAGRHGAERDRSMDWAKSVLPQARAKFLDAAPDDALPAYVTEAKIGLLIMGAYGHSPLRRFIVGSTTTTMIRRCLVPVLLFR